MELEVQVLSSSGSGIQTEENKNHGALPTILDGKYFEVHSVDGKKIKAKCKLCNPIRFIDGAKVPTSNFTTHLKRCHPEGFLEYEKYKTKVQENLKERNKAVKRSATSLDNNQPPISKYMKSSSETVTQNQLDKMILKFVTNSMSPITVVDGEPFRKLIKGLCPEHLTIMCSETLKKRVKDETRRIKQKITEILENTDYICCTADIWSGGKRSYFGMTAHILNSSLERESYSLTCRRFRGTHSFDRVAESVIDVFDHYQIAKQKVVCVVTDNGSNFVKAFEEFGAKFFDDDATAIENQQLHGAASANEQSHNLESDEESDNESMANELINLDDPRIPQYSLPPLHRCSTHTLNLVSKDCTKVPKGDGEAAYSKLLRASMAKCSALWNKSSYPKSAEIIFSLAGKNLKTPNATRWNSTYDAMVRLLQIKDKLDEVCSSLNLPMFRKQEIEFCEQYVRCMSPIAVALDILQGETTGNKPGRLYFGTLAPTIRSAYEKLVNLKDDPSMNLTQPLISSLIAALNMRYDYVILSKLDDPRFRMMCLASITHPYFKLRWLEPDVQNDCKLLFLKESVNHMPTTEVTTRPVESAASSFFVFPTQGAGSAVETGNSCHLECLQYLQNPDESLEMLSRYPTIKRMFRKFNTPIPSSAPVERMFSYSGMILTPKRRTLNDQTFEDLLILKCNDTVLQKK